VQQKEMDSVTNYSSQTDRVYKYLTSVRIVKK